MKIETIHSIVFLTIWPIRFMASVVDRFCSNIWYSSFMSWRGWIFSNIIFVMNFYNVTKSEIPRTETLFCHFLKIGIVRLDLHYLPVVIMLLNGFNCFSRDSPPSLSIVVSQVVISFVFLVPSVFGVYLPILFLLHYFYHIVLLLKE